MTVRDLAPGLFLSIWVAALCLAIARGEIWLEPAAPIHTMTAEEIAHELERLPTPEECAATPGLSDDCVYAAELAYYLDGLRFAALEDEDG